MENAVPCVYVRVPKSVECVRAHQKTTAGVHCAVRAERTFATELYSMSMGLPVPCPLDLLTTLKRQKRRLVKMTSVLFYSCPSGEFRNQK